MMQDVSRGWILTDEKGHMQKVCGNCNKFGGCERYHTWKSKPCKKYDDVGGDDDKKSH